MKYRAGARPQGGGRWVELELDDGDMADHEGWEKLSFTERYKRMAARAEMTMVHNMVAHGDISPEYATQRIAAIREMFGA